MSRQEVKDKTFIRVTSQFTAGGIQFNIFIHNSTHANAAPINMMRGLRNKDAKKLNEFLDKYSDAQPFDGLEVINELDGARTKRFIKEIREYR